MAIFPGEILLRDLFWGGVSEGVGRPSPGKSYIPAGGAEGGGGQGKERRMFGREDFHREGIGASLAWGCLLGLMAVKMLLKAQGCTTTTEEGEEREEKEARAPKRKGGGFRRKIKRKKEGYPLSKRQSRSTNRRAGGSPYGLPKMVILIPGGKTSGKATLG